MTDEEFEKLADRIEGDPAKHTWQLYRDTAEAIRQLMEELKQARIAGAWLYGLELERPADYAEQKPLAMHACRAAFTHPQALS